MLLIGLRPSQSKQDPDRIPVRATVGAAGFGLVAVMAVVLGGAPALAEQRVSHGTTEAVSVVASDRSGLTDEDADASPDGLGVRPVLVSIDAMVAKGRIAEAQARLADLAPETRAEALHITFLQGLIAKKSGRSREAIVVFRQLLAAEPDMVRVRFALAHTLFEVEDDEAARHHFELVRGGARHPRLLEQISHFLAELDARKRWSATGYVTLAPSTNVNQGTTESVIIVRGLEFEIDEDSRAKSGLGLAAGGSIGLRHTLAPDVDLQLGLGAHTTQYSESAYNQGQVSFSAGPRWRFDDGHIGVRGFVQHKWSGNHALARVGGLAVDARYRVAPRWTVSGALGCHWSAYETNYKGSNLSARDGRTCDVDAVVSRSLSQSVVVKALAGGAANRAHSSYYDYDEGYVGVGGYAELPYGVTVAGDVRALRREYADINIFIGDERVDKELNTSVSLTKRDFTVLGVAPQLRYSYTRRDSNLDVYDHDTHGADLSFTRAF